MRGSKNDGIELNTTRCFVAFDAQTGDVLYVHEFMSEVGAVDSAWDAEAVRQAASRDFGPRPLKALAVPRGMEPKEGYAYRIDIKSQTVIEEQRPMRRFRDFIAPTSRGRSK